MESWGFAVRVVVWKGMREAFQDLYKKRPFRGKNNEQLTASIISDTVTLVNLFQDRESISQNCTDAISSVRFCPKVK